MPIPSTRWRASTSSACLPSSRGRRRSPRKSATVSASCAGGAPTRSPPPARPSSRASSRRCSSRCLPVNARDVPIVAVFLRSQPAKFASACRPIGAIAGRVGAGLPAFTFRGTWPCAATRAAAGPRVPHQPARRAGPRPPACRSRSRPPCRSQSPWSPALPGPT